MNSRLMNLHLVFTQAWQRVWSDSRWRGHLIISLVFLLLLASLLLSLGRYWNNTLQPRLYASAETQAQILAQSQASVLTKAIEHGKPEALAKQLFELIQEILLATDPAIGERMVQGLSLSIDYDMVPVTVGTLDLRDGEQDCQTCFQISLPLLSQTDSILGVVEFAISDGYYHTLSREMKSKLYAESSLALVLLLAVWITMLVMFHRLHRAKQIIEASDQAKTRFMANVTHELRTPLNAILGYTQMYKAEPALMKSYGQGIDTIDRSAEHLLLLINDILDFSRMDQQKLTLHPREINLASFLNTLVEMARIRAKLKGISFRYQFPEQLPASLLADDKRLRQVLLNLLSNAVKFTEQGEVNFTAHLLHREPGSVKLRFGVSDTGIGIAKADLRKIFIPFHQLDNPITRAEGSGLGLTISQRIVRLMGSELKVRSQLELGSEFWFDLELPTQGESLTRLENPATPNTAAQVALPPAEVLNELLRLSRQHNVLAVRSLLQNLEREARFPDFVAEIQPLVRNYRFKQLADWLEQVNQI